jgi:hypothetical protein
MANQKSVTAKRARFKRDDKKQADRGTRQYDNGNEAPTYEEELAHYLQERIEPGLNRRSIALLARSIAKEIAHRRPDEDADVAAELSNEEDDDVRAGVDDDDVRGEADDEVDDEEEVDEEEDDDVQAQANVDFSDEEDGNEGSLEDEMRDLQANLGDDWILRVSIQGEDAWLTAEKYDGSQHVEARAANVLAEVVELLNEHGGRASALRELR